MSRDHRSTLGRLLADGEHLSASVSQHWQQLKEAGVTEAERKSLEAGLGRVRVIYESIGQEADAGLEQAREALKDTVGKYRRCAWPIANPITGHDRKAESALRTAGTFPRNDAELKKYVVGLPARLRSYAGKLAARGFSKEEQQALADQARAFLKALAAVGHVKGKAAARRMKEEKEIESFRLALRYFRGAANAAFHERPERTDFDRVAFPPKVKKVVPPRLVPPPASAEGAAAAK